MSVLFFRKSLIDFQSPDLTSVVRAVVNSSSAAVALFCVAAVVTCTVAGVARERREMACLKRLVNFDSGVVLEGTTIGEVAMADTELGADMLLEVSGGWVGVLMT